MQKATYNDKAHVVSLLCESFDTNKSVNYVVKQDEKRKERIKRLMSYSFDMCYLFGNIYLSDDKKACALTLFPETKKINLKTIWLDFNLVVQCIGITRVFKVLKRESEIKSYYPQKPILYLWLFGVEKAFHGKGVGSNLLKELALMSDEIKRPIYLETSMPQNVFFYKKNGFEVYKELNFGHQLYLIKRG